MKGLFKKIWNKLKAGWKRAIEIQETIDRARERSGWGKI